MLSAPPKPGHQLTDRRGENPHFKVLQEFNYSFSPMKSTAFRRRKLPTTDQENSSALPQAEPVPAAARPWEGLSLSFLLPFLFFFYSSP